MKQVDDEREERVSSVGSQCAIRVRGRVRVIAREITEDCRVRVRVRVRRRDMHAQHKRGLSREFSTHLVHLSDPYPTPIRPLSDPYPTHVSHMHLFQFHDPLCDGLWIATGARSGCGC